MARSKEEMERWEQFRGFLKQLINAGFGDKVATGITGVLMQREADIDALFTWADTYFDKEIDQCLMNAVGPKQGETVH